MMASANVVMRASAQVSTPTSRPAADDDPDDEREQRHPAAAGQRQAGQRLAPLEARPAGHDQVAEDDRERHGLRRAR